jgi:hypothetical protein
LNIEQRGFPPGFHKLCLIFTGEGKDIDFMNGRIKVFGLWKDIDRFELQDGRLDSNPCTPKTKHTPFINIAPRPAYGSEHH